MATVGILYPGHSAEDDFEELEARLGTAVTFPLAITTVGEDAHRVDALLDLGKAERLADGVARLSTAHPESMMWACTSGSFVFGVDGAREQVDQVAVAAGVPASSTSIAFADALQHMGIRRVAVAASYPEEVAGGCPLRGVPVRRWGGRGGDGLVSEALHRAFVRRHDSSMCLTTPFPAALSVTAGLTG